MLKSIILILSCTIVLSACKVNNPEIKAGSGDAGFQQLSDSFLLGYLSWRPQNSVSLGFHEYDGRLTDLSKGSIDRELMRLKDYNQKLESLDSSALSEKMFYDYRILKLAIESEIFKIEDLKIYTLNPMTYAGLIDVNIYISRNFAPIEDRIRSIIAIENQAEQQFDYAKANLADSLGKPYVETAIQIAKGSVTFLSSDLVIALKDVKNDSLMNAFKASNKKAIEAINGYISWLERKTS